MSERPADPGVTGADRPDPSTPRWSELKPILEAALTLESSEWGAFLDVRCGTDEVLRGELESLLDAYESDSDFLEEPVQILQRFEQDEAVDKTRALPPDLRIGAYRLDTELGRGGMGTVYLAHRADSEFEQQVAIKLVRSEKLNEVAIRRFRQERQILANLEHPYIARLLDGGTTESGVPYFVMEYVQGQVLTEYCDSKALHTRERVSLFVRICSAIQYAHERSIIHRDIKPGNILVTAAGVPKLLDFGIAKILEAEPSANDATVVGFHVLTPAYSSPEQIRGDVATARSDVYSLGVVLYELLCGERPSLRLTHKPTEREDPREAHVPPRLRAIVYNAIRPDPGERYQSVTALSEDLDRYLEGAPLVTTGESARERVSIGVLPFRQFNHDSTPPDPFLASALVDALVTRLSKIDRLSVRPTSAVLKFAHRNDEARAGRELRVQYVLEGSIHVSGIHMRVNVQLVSTETGVAIWASRFEESSAELLSLEDSISEQITYALIPHLTGDEEDRLKRSGTTNRRAHEAYLRGRFHLNRSAGEPEELAKSLVCFTQAVAEDPAYAAAHAGLADYYLRLALWGGLPPAESFAASIHEARTALGLDPTLAEAHATLGFCLWGSDRDYSAAEREFQLAIVHNPEYASTHHWYGLLNSARNQPDLALVNLERARKIDVSSPVIAAALGYVHYNARQYTKSLELLLEAARDLRSSAVLSEMLAWTYLQVDDVPKAVEAARRAAELSNRSPAGLAALASAEAAAGRRHVADAICRELNELRNKRYVSGYDVATAYQAAGEATAALTELERAFEMKDWWLSWIRVDPRWDSLRGEARFRALVAKTQPAEQPPQHMARRTARTVFVIPALATIAALAVLAFVFLQRLQPVAPLRDAHITKLTGDGTAGLAAISEDARYIAYTTGRRGQSILWLRDLEARSVRRLSSFPDEMTGLHFSYNGNQLVFQSYPILRPFERTLYALPVSGGSAAVLRSAVSGPATLSPDGSRTVFFKANSTQHRDELWVSDRNGQDRMLLTTTYPSRLSWVVAPAWSAGGDKIAYAVERPQPHGSNVTVELADVTTGATQSVPGPPWLYVQNLAWAGEKGIVVSAREHTSAFLQLWYLALNGKARARIGSDVESYWGVSANRDASKLVSVQVQTLSNIYVKPPGSVDQSSQVTPGTGRYFDLSWTPAGKLLYASDSSGLADIWLINADGSEPHQLTASAGLNWGPVAGPDGTHIAFHSNRSGSWQIWQANADGSQPVQMTSEGGDSTWAHYTNDGKYILFERTDAGGRTSIWRVPEAGGQALQLTTFLTAHPVSSPRGGTIAAWYSPSSEHQDWKLALFPPGGGSPVKVFEIPMPVTPESQLAWTPSGNGIAFLAVSDSVFNIWLQPVDGSPVRRLTSYTSGQIYSLDWSRQASLAYSHGITTTDVVLAQPANRR